MGSVSSLRRAIERRWASGSELLFVMRDGKGWNRPANPIQKRFQVIQGWAGLPDQASFYWLRHTAATVGDGAGDPVAIRYILGHADHSMAGVYREEIDPARIWEVVHHIERWFQAKT